jgi:hypothetical protein
MNFFKKNILLVHSALVLCGGMIVCLQAESDNFTNSTFNLKTQLHLLNPDKSFVHFNVGLSEADKNILQQLKINEQSFYNNFGKFDQLIPEITMFLKSVGNSDHIASAIAHMIQSIVMQALLAVEKPSAWIAVRCFKKQDTFKIPRWHTDGQHPIIYKIGIKYKITCTLKGPGTLFCAVSDDLKQKFYEIQNNTLFTQQDVRNKLADLLKILSIQTSKPHEGTIFLISDYAAIHSEPDIDQDRLYVGIMPGTQEQIKQMMT